MKIEKITVEKLHISGIKNLDPIHVFFEDIKTDYNPNAGRIVIVSYTSAWTAFFGSIGDGRDIKQFFLDCDIDYLAKNLIKYGMQTESDVGGTVNNLKKMFLKLRREGKISATFARCYWNCHFDKWAGLPACETVEDIGSYINTADVTFDVSGEKEYNPFEDWYLDGIATKLTPEAEWMRNRIIPAIKEALEQEEAAQ